MREPTSNLVTPPFIHAFAIPVQLKVPFPGCFPVQYITHERSNNLLNSAYIMFMPTPLNIMLSPPVVNRPAPANFERKEQCRGK